MPFPAIASIAAPAVTPAATPAVTDPMATAPPQIRPAMTTREAPTLVGAEAAANATLTLKPLNAEMPPLVVRSGEIVGRAEGPHSAVLSRFHSKGISRSHCRFDFRGGSGWSITDLGSSSGTEMLRAPKLPNRADEKPIMRSQPCPMASGAFLRLGDLLFQVSAVLA
jgi:hypothetical protein